MDLKVLLKDKYFLTFSGLFLAWLVISSLFIRFVVQENNSLDSQILQEIKENNKLLKQVLEEQKTNQEPRRSK